VCAPQEGDQLQKTGVFPGGGKFPPPTITMPELINANPTVLSASAIPSRNRKSSSDPFQDLLTTHTAASDWDSSSTDDDDSPERFDSQEIYGLDTPDIFY
jgi:hypothetical protein